MPDQQYTSVDVVIQGGGMVGLSLAIALAREKLRVVVIEKTKIQAQLEPHFDGRVSAIAQSSKRMFETLGVWDHLAPHAEPILDIRASDGAANVFLHFDHSEVGDGPFGYIVENRYIRHALWQVAQSLPYLNIMDTNGIAHFSADDAAVEVVLQNAERLRCQLLVGADGKQSKVRLAANIAAVEKKYHQTAIVCTIEHALPHEGLAQERFLPAGPFAVLPMTRADNGWYRSSLVWVEADDRVQLYMELSDAECVQEIRERVGDYLGDIRLAGPRFTYPLTLMHAKTYIGKRIALIGDAAHGIHPLAGQGVNLGFRDVAVLAELVTDRFHAGQDIATPELLTHYQRWRRFDNVAMMVVTDTLNRLFCNDLAPIRLARGLGLWAVGKMPPLKRFFMRDAMGVVGDLPKLIKENH